MKIGIVTIHHTKNFGGCLQAVALQEYLKDRYQADVGLVDYCPEIITDIYRGFSVPKYFRMIRKGNVIGALRSCMSDIFHFRRKYKIDRRFVEFYKKFYCLLGDKVKTYKKLNAQNIKVDVLATGSDQVWNGDLFDGLDKVYFLKFWDKNIKRVAISASMGHDTLFKERAHEYQALLNDYQYISTREACAKNLLEDLAPCDVHNTLDPTLMLTGDQWLNLFSQGVEIPHIPYIFVYTISWSDRVMDYVRKLSEEKGVPVVTVLGKKRFTNELGYYPECTPDDFVRLISGAKYVVTNSFHGTVFSVLFGKQFWTFLNKDRNSRMKDFLSALGIESRLVASDQSAEPEQMPIDYTAVFDKLSELRIKTNEYLDMALAECGKENE